QRRDDRQPITMVSDIPGQKFGAQSGPGSKHTRPGAHMPHSRKVTAHYVGPTARGDLGAVGVVRTAYVVMTLTMGGYASAALPPPSDAQKAQAAEAAAKTAWSD